MKRLTMSLDDDLADAFDALVRERGYALDDGEQETGVRCVAVPVPGGPSMTALSVSGPAGRLAMDAVPSIVTLLQDAAAALAAELREDVPRPLSGRSS